MIGARSHSPVGCLRRYPVDGDQEIRTLLADDEH